MLTAQAAIGPLLNANRKSLIRKECNNAAILTFTRADYEMRSLKRVREITKRTMTLLMRARTAESFAVFSRELERWIERERVLLRIKLPGVEAPREIAAQSSAPTVYEVDRSTTAPAVMNDATPSSPAQPASSTPTAQ